MGPSVQRQISALAEQGLRVEEKNAAVHRELREGIDFNLKMTKRLGYLQLGALVLIMYRMLKDRKKG